MPISINRISNMLSADARPAKLLDSEDVPCRILRLQDLATGIVASVVEVEVPEEALERFGLSEEAHVAFAVKGEDEGQGAKEPTMTKEANPKGNAERFAPVAQSDRAPAS